MQVAAELALLLPGSLHIHARMHLGPLGFLQVLESSCGCCGTAHNLMHVAVLPVLRVHLQRREAVGEAVH